MLAAKRGHLDALRQAYATPDACDANLFACVAAGLCDCAEDLIANLDWPPNDEDMSMDCCTLLSLVCYKGDVEMVRMLLDNGADPAWRSPYRHIQEDPWYMLFCQSVHFSRGGVFPDPPTATASDRNRIAALSLAVRVQSFKPLRMRQLRNVPRRLAHMLTHSAALQLRQRLPR